MQVSLRDLSAGLLASMGKFGNIKTVHKFGAAPSGIQVTSTDIWDRADASPTQQIHVAPTQARRHQLLSTSDADSDTGGTVAQGAGARTVQLYGLATWASKESSEIVTMDGTATGGNAVWTTGTYVFVHRVKVLTAGATVGGNVGTITAIAETDASISASILPNNGQTEMAIYAVPSAQSFYLTDWRANIDKATGGVASANFELRVNSAPDVNLTLFLRKHDIATQSTGANMVQSHFTIPIKFAGPCIIKVQAIASAADIDGESSFDGYLIDN
jgi:hypothetical protein